MQTEIIIAGFGGQGVLFAGQLLAYAALDEGKQVTWFPSYGPEMRGGTANCTVILSDEEIGSPLVRNPQSAIVMNLPSLDKYEPLVRQGGLLVVDGSMVNRPAARTDIRTVVIPANEIAEQIGDRRLMNIVLLGSALANEHILPVEAVENALRKHIPQRHRELLEGNLRALAAGMEYLVKA